VSGNSKDIYSLQGAGRRNLLAGVSFSLGALSMIGIPLFSGFVSKFYFVQASFQNPDKMLPALTFMVLSTVLTAMYYLPVLVTIYISSDDKSPHRKERSKNTWNYSTAIVAFVLLNFVLGIFFEPVIKALEQGLSMF
jgi:multicomponent Na+:H+ antiporter subunit D